MAALRPLQHLNSMLSKFTKHGLRRFEEVQGLPGRQSLPGWPGARVRLSIARTVGKFGQK